MAQCPKPQPLDRIEWVDASTLTANDYNPNKVFPPELALLKISMLEDGWTQPVVATEQNEIVDGFHRWTLCSTDPEVAAMTGGKVPVVRLPAGKTKAERMLATIRHNRARGQHGILRMSKIVIELHNAGLSEEEIGHRLQMEDEEVQRLSDQRGSPEAAGKESFGQGWVPSA